MFPQVEQHINIMPAQAGSSVIEITLGENEYSVEGSISEAIKHALLNTPLIFRYTYISKTQSVQC